MSKLTHYQLVECQSIKSKIFEDPKSALPALKFNHSRLRSSPHHVLKKSNSRLQKDNYISSIKEPQRVSSVVNKPKEQRMLQSRCLPIVRHGSFPHHAYSDSEDKTNSRVEKHSIKALKLTGNKIINRSENSDLFYYMNLKATGFDEILQAQFEDSSPYSYLSNPVSKPFKHSKAERVRKNKMICACSGDISHKRYSFIRHFYPKLKKLSAHALPFYKKVHFQPGREERILIFNVEGVLFERIYSDVGRCLVRSCIFKSLCKLQKHYKLILVYQNSYRGISRFLSRLKDEKVHISGTYEVASMRTTCPNVLDYTAIYKDFHVHFPSSDVLIVTSHKLLSEEIEGDTIAYKHGLYSHVLMDRAPIAYRESQPAPITLVVPSLSSAEHSVCGSAIMKTLKSVKSFSNLLLNSNLRIVSSPAVVMSVMEQVAHISASTVRNLEMSKAFCSVHHQPKIEAGGFPVNHFLIMKNSAFHTSPPEYMLIT